MVIDKEPYYQGSRLELFVEDFLIEELKNAERRIHHPVPQERSITFDRPWEGNTSTYVTVFEDGDIYRMYYRGSNYDWEEEESRECFTCYAESDDGLNWRRPDLGIFEYLGSKNNNIVWKGLGTHNFSPFKDKNPDCERGRKYKAIGGSVREGGLFAFHSADGVHWELTLDEPVIKSDNRSKYKFDSQNIAFWDREAGLYREYHRGSREKYRDILTSTSRDFLNWSEPVFLDFGECSLEHLYTNAVVPYPRAEHILLGFPKRFLTKRKKVLDHPLPGVSDGVLMASRDGVTWERWLEALVRPGLQRERWWERNNMIARGLLLTEGRIPGTPREISIYLNEGYYETGTGLRRHTLRMDGFVSIHSGSEEGEIMTRDIIFEGEELLVNYSTSAAGWIRAEILDTNSDPIPGFELRRCEEIYGDELEGLVTWDGDGDLSELSCRPIKLRFKLRDADIYSFRFA